MATYQLECDALHLKEFVTLSTVCNKMTEERGEIFKELAKVGG